MAGSVSESEDEARAGSGMEQPALDHDWLKGGVLWLFEARFGPPRNCKGIFFRRPLPTTPHQVFPPLEVSQIGANAGMQGRLRSACPMRKEQKGGAGGGPGYFAPLPFANELSVVQFRIHGQESPIKGIPSPLQLACVDPPRGAGRDPHCHGRGLGGGLRPGQALRLGKQHACGY